ncbi:hypothetical protein P4H28_22605, partial [Paenibacillus larvae]
RQMVPFSLPRFAKNIDSTYIVAMLMVFTFPITPTHAANNDAVLDTDGNPVLAGKEYAVRVLTYDDNGKYLGWNYWKQFNWIGTNWTRLAATIEWYPIVYKLLVLESFPYHSFVRIL